jgi:hypothetical protein
VGDADAAPAKVSAVRQECKPDGEGRRALARSVAAVVLAVGGWLALHCKGSSTGLFWTGVELMAFAGIGILRGVLLLSGGDCE